MKRSPHRLQPNRRGEIPAHLLFVDTEARIEHLTKLRERHTLRLGYALYVRRQRGGRTKEEGSFFRTPEEFWDIVEDHVRDQRRLYLFAHNWNYDAGIVAMATHPPRRGWRCDSYVNERPPFILTWRRYSTEEDIGNEEPAEEDPTGPLCTPFGVVQVRESTLKLLRDAKMVTTASIKVLDSLNYFGQSLAAIGMNIGLAKGEVEDFETVSDEELMPYNERDTRILAKLVLSFLDYIEAQDLGNFQPTLASQAFTAWRHRFLKQPVFIHADQEVCDLERDAYHGGRTEAFHIGRLRKKLVYLDVNSLYPYVMQRFSYPVRLIDKGECMRLTDAEKLIRDGYGLIARCRVATDVPVFAHVERKLLFPVGRFEEALTTPCIAYGLSEDLIEHIGSFAVYEQAPIFVEYVSAFYDMRLGFKESGNDLWAYMSKFLLNSLYGKTGQTGEVWRDTGDLAEPYGRIWHEQEEDGGPDFKYRVRMGHVQRLEQETETRDSFPAIAAHVTAYARMLLWTFMLQAGREHVYYTDTDSLVVDREGFRRLRDAGHVDPDRLGALKVEDTFWLGHIRGAKDYLLHSDSGKVTEHIKGVSARARKVQHDLYEQLRFESWDVSAARGDDGAVIVETMRKTLKRNYDKGTVTGSGRVEPFVV